MKIKKSDIPKDSILKQYYPVDYIDAFECDFNTNKNITPDDIQIALWGSNPKWLDVLYKIRAILVKPFGLETSNKKDSSKLEEIIRTGGEHSIMKVVGKSEKETALVLSDSHLDAYMSVYIISNDSIKRITATTLVKYKNNIGKIYFFFIKPFHKIVVKQIIKHTIKKLIYNQNKTEVDKIKLLKTWHKVCIIILQLLSFIALIVGFDMSNFFIITVGILGIIIIAIYIFYTRKKEVLLTSTEPDEIKIKIRNLKLSFVPLIILYNIITFTIFYAILYLLIIILIFMSAH